MRGRSRTISLGAALVRIAVVALAFGAATAALAPPAAAQPASPTCVEIVVEGNVRVESEAVTGQIRTRPGDEVTARGIGADVRAIYELGFFDDVSVDATETAEGIVLRYIVREKPSIGAVEFVGNRKLKEEDFNEAIDLRVGSILDVGAVRRAVRAIEELYREKGYFLAEVAYTLEDRGPGEVTVRIEIDEHAKIRIGSVTIVGNESLEDDEIVRYMQTRPGGLLSFLSGGGTFDMSNLEQDLQTIRILHYDNGFIDVAVSDPVVEISRDRNRLHIAIRIDEGDRYSVSSVSVSGDLLETQEETMARTTLTADETFRSSRLREDIEAIQTYYKDLGYAFANVDVLTDVDPVANTISVTYDLNRGELAYIGRIRFVGNASTRDRVIRREMAIHEGERYSSSSIARSKLYIQRLGFFETVTIRERPSSLGANLIDLEVEVTERHTRSLQVGAGFSSAESFLATAQISENNLMGRGQSLSLNIMLSSIRSLFVLSFVEPHLWGSRVSLQLDLFNRQLAYRNFDRLSRGASASFGYRPFMGHPFWRDLTIFAGYRVEDVRIRNVSTTRSLRFFQSGLTSSITTGVSLDRRNDRLMTTRGYYLAVNNELADKAWGSEFEFDRVRGIGRVYTQARFLDCAAPGEVISSGGRVVAGACRWLRSWVVRGNFELGYVGATSPNTLVPASELFYPGGPNSVRGFEQFSLGPRGPAAGQGANPLSTTGDVVLGGNREVLIQAEIEFPLIAPVGIRGVLFADAGNAFAADDPFSLRLDVRHDLEDNLVLRTALGFGFRWQSPLGMLRFEWGFPLQVRPTERRAVFNFSIGPSF